MAKVDVPVDLYVAAYADARGAQQDWDAIRRMVKDKVLTVEALVLVSRDSSGKIHVRDNVPNVGVGATLGAIGGAVVGLIFPPALLASTVLGAGIGAGAGGVVGQVQKHQIKADLEATLPPGSSAIVAVVEERWVSQVQTVLTKAERREHHHAHGRLER
jgi:uncharacterized membrane protein